MWARIHAGAVAEIVPETDTPIQKRFHPAVVAMLVAVPAEQASTVQVGWLYDGATFTAPAPVAPPAPLPYDVPKLLVVDRLIAAGKLRDARAALKLGVADSKITNDDELALRERWEAARVIASDDAEARGLFSAIGADPDVILAPA